MKEECLEDMERTSSFKRGGNVGSGACAALVTSLLYNSSLLDICQFACVKALFELLVTCHSARSLHS